MRKEKINRAVVDGRKIVIYGFGITGKWLSGIVDAEYIVDTDSKKWGEKINGKIVESPSQLLPLDPNLVVIVTVVDIFDVTPFLEHYKIPYVPLTDLLGSGEEFRVFGNTTNESIDFVEYSVKTVLVCQDASLRENSLYLRSVDLVITEKCTLKCRDCANLMQFYENPRTYSTDFIVTGLASLASKCDFIHEARIIGGEPFINKEIYSVLDIVCSYENINKVVIYTNGMIPPNRQKLLGMASGIGKLIFSVTDYAELGRNLDKTIAIVEELGIPFRVHPPEHWTDSGRILQYPTTNAEAEEKFAKCCGKNLYTLIGENLYRCPFAANAEQFGGVPFRSTNSVSVKGTRDEIKHFSYGVDVIDACSLCPGRSFDAPIIKPAVQVSSPLSYRVYPIQMTD